MQDRPNYQQELLERCGHWWTQVEEAVASDSLVSFDWPKILHDFVKQVALDSFKNGVAAGMRRAGRPQQGNAPRPPRNYKGSALNHGRLQRPDRDLVVDEFADAD